MAQTHSHVDYMDYSNLVNLDEIMNIGTKGYFKPIVPDHRSDGHCCVDPISQLDNQLLDKVDCPYENPETGMLPPNCKYNDCRECPACNPQANTSTYGATAPKSKRGRPRKNADQPVTQPEQSMSKRGRGRPRKVNP